MSIKIDQDLCIGCGACESLCPNVFKINQHGKSEVINQTDFACVKNAAESCPAQAIEVK
ncbi:MAG: ferredoxin [Flavobacterium sp.]|nr:ferredoxin [Flavobacterium sp.]